MNEICNIPNESARVLAVNRKIIQKFGPFFGQKLFTIKAVCPDLKWKEDVQNDKNTLRKEVLAYVLKDIDIRSLDVLDKDLDGAPKIIINKADNDPYLVFKMEPPQFAKATRENVQECIERERLRILNKSNATPIFFSAADLPTLVDLLRIANQSALTFYEEQSRKMMNLAGTVRGYMDSTERMHSEYLRQCGIDANETEVHVQVGIEEK